ncbi:unnamed protein product [Closterium sp. NIES-53]
MLLGRWCLAPTLLLLPLATSCASPRKSSSLAATTSTAATTATPTAATTASTKATTPATTTTSIASTTSTAAPTTTPAPIATTSATLALTIKSSPNILSTKDVNSSNKGIGGGKGGGGTPLKEGRARSVTSGTYSDYTSLNYKEVLLE